MVLDLLSHNPLLTATVLFVALYLQWYRNRLKSVDHLPGLRVAFSPLSLPGALLPTSSWNPGLGWYWQWRTTAYMNHENDIISIVPFVFGKPLYYTCSSKVAQHLLSNETKVNLEKPKLLSRVFLLWGESLISANGNLWKKFRRLLAPAFTPQTFSLVFRESVAIYREMLAEQGWDRENEAAIDDVGQLALRMTLVVLARCGFGVPLSWSEEATTDGSIPFGESLNVVCHTHIERLVIPNWAYKLPIQRLQHMDKAWKALGVYMRELIAARRSAIDSTSIEAQTEKGDLFTRLIEALDEDARIGLEESEVIGNTFALMFAGHETTARTLTATLGYLALYQDEQAKAYSEIVQLLGSRTELTLEDVTKMDFIHGCFHEALRLHPAGPMLPRDLTKDVYVELQHPYPRTMCLPKGSRVIIDMIGIHHNPHTFPEPERFKPSRWEGVPEHEVTMFGWGPRACIGRKFATTEAVTVLALFLRDWMLEVALEPGETIQTYQERVMGQSRLLGLAFGVETVPIKFCRRHPL
ncbi:unnamed protein product [Somion occarium]|uniref:Cytochrome P450 n=1 Tax=Somion occarium TaxID=3059160 RepID=A0ABP1DVM2_9APHY